MYDELETAGDDAEDQATLVLYMTHTIVVLCERVLQASFENQTLTDFDYGFSYFNVVGNAGGDCCHRAGVSGYFGYSRDRE